MTELRLPVLYDQDFNILATDTRRHTQTITYFCLGDLLYLARDRLAQSKAPCCEIFIYYRIY